MQLTHDILDRLDQLEQKYAVMGQDILSYLDGLLYADYLTYWDYIHLDTLLSLQTPRTPLPDENIFIIYHQITELYFKLSIQAIHQLREQEVSDGALFKRQIKRLNTYFENLIQSFDLMVDGMDREEFLKFRMSLLPSSGFQSAQYRIIELLSTDMELLVHPSMREQVVQPASPESLYPMLYWKSGATELATGKKTLTLQQFEHKYSNTFIQLGYEASHNNLYRLYLSLEKEKREEEELIHLMRQYDFNVNIRWRLAHLRSAVRYLDKKPQVIAATGGTNWQQYLPPKNQRIVFFPELWGEDELEKWGKSVKF
ncbi:MAG TPA: tryptophan 2,3-dioxygenase family protein [Saprospiraceae bacterium]|nr:tryptophan 2,3-dioxygenase family protein [Saprospiraceae bacterium]HMQ83791.1 tryptophan 2,3-dioxygenase family protein [Saprospiraceae bacterium]